MKGRYAPALAHEFLPSFPRNIFSQHAIPMSLFRCLFRPHKCVSACVAFAHNLLSIERWKPALSKLFAIHLYTWRARETSPSVIVSFKSLLASSKPLKSFNFRSFYRLLVLMKKSLSKIFSRSALCVLLRKTFRLFCVQFLHFLARFLSGRSRVIQFYCLY